MKWRISALILSVCMLFSSCLMATFAASGGTGEGGFIYEARDEDAGTIEITGYTGTLTAGQSLSVPAEIDGLTVVSISGTYGDYNNRYGEFILPDTIETISDLILQGFTGTLEVPESVAEIGGNDGFGMFFGTVEELILNANMETYRKNSDTGMSGIGQFHNNQLKKIVIGDGIKYFSAPAYWGRSGSGTGSYYYENLDTIIVSDSVHYIDWAKNARPETTFYLKRFKTPFVEKTSEEGGVWGTYTVFNDTEVYTIERGIALGLEGKRYYYTDAYGELPLEGLGFDKRGFQSFREQEGTSYRTYDGLYVGWEGTLELILCPLNTTDNSDVVWSSSNENVAVVENGNVRAVGVGKTVITATMSGKSISVPIMVKGILVISQSNGVSADNLAGNIKINKEEILASENIRLELEADKLDPKEWEHWEHLKKIFEDALKKTLICTDAFDIHVVLKNETSAWKVQPIEGKRISIWMPIKDVDEISRRHLMHVNDDGSFSELEFTYEPIDGLHGIRFETESFSEFVLVTDDGDEPNEPLDHVHDFTRYTAEGDTIYGTCSKDNCPDDGIVKLFTITAPTDAVYEQGTHHTASLEGYDSQVQLDSDAIVYTKDDVVTDPVNAGTYIASYTYENETASVEYEIEKALLTITAKSYIITVGSEIPDLNLSDAYTISGLTGSDDVSVLSSNIRLRYDNQPDSTEEGYYSIWFENEPTADNYYVNCVSGELRIAKCVHEFTEYYLGTVNEENDSIYAKCSKGCNEYGSGGVIVTLRAPEDAVYEQGLYHNASLGHNSQVKIDYESIVYTRDGETADPVDAGTYTASITCGGQTARVTYTVAKRSLTITADNKTVYAGSRAPAYTYTVSGWSSNYDAEDEFSHKVSNVTAVCRNANLNRAGTYAISISGTPVVLDYYGNDVSANYNLTVVDGTLTVKSYPYVPSTPSTPPSVSVTIPISGNENTIRVDASVTGNTATVDHVDFDSLDTVIGEHVDTGTVTIDFSGLGSSDPITTVEIPSIVVKEIADAVNDPNNDAQSLEIILSDGTSIEFDAVALGEKAAQADGKDITISIEHSDDVKTLTDAQKSTLGDRPAFEINVTSGGEHISDMGGKITVHAPYKLKDGEKAAGIVVWYVDDNGNKERCETSYDPVKQRVNWKTDHLSLYVIGYDEELANICQKDETCPMYSFTDLVLNNWYHDGVHYCVENGLMEDVGNKQFNPNGTTTRAMIVTILWRLEGSPVVNYAMDFEDVESGKWYTEAIRWAASEKIVEGYGNGKFGTNDPITREQFATILYRYEQNKGGGFTGVWMIRMDFVDLADVSDWAYEAMCWMNMNGVVTGKPGKVLDPKGGATRAEAATMLQRYCELSEEDK